jgi:outer membrane receptor protein involved in Fe transport
MKVNAQGGAARLWATLLVLGLPIAMPVSAQIEDIVVTARKKEESLQEVPLSIAAFTGEQLQARGISNNYEVALFTPNFNTVKTVGRNLDRPTIRGMANASRGGEPNASYFVDGVFVTGSISTAMTDAVDRVEVLRGPQSAQFGRATFSGAINYVTRKPTNDFEGQVNLKYGSDDDKKAGGWFSGPIIEDKLGFLISGAYEKYDGEWNNNLNTAVTPPTISPNPPFFNFAFEDARLTTDDFSDMGGEETKDFMAKLTWTPTDATEINVKFGYTDADDDHFSSLVPNVNIAASPSGINNCFLPGSPEAGPDTPSAFCGTYSGTDGWENRVNLPDIREGMTVVDNYPLGASGYPLAVRTASSIKPGTRRDTYRYLLDGTQGFGEWDLGFRAAYNKDEFIQAYDLDHTQDRGLVGLFNFIQDAKWEDYQYELRLSSPVENRLRGSVGVYYYDAERDDLIRSVVGPYVLTGTLDNYNRIIGQTPGVTGGLDPNFFGDQAIKQKTTNKAVFGSVDFDLTDQWTLAVEGRYSDDEKKIGGGNSQRNSDATDPDTGLLIPLNSVGNKVTTKTFTPRFTLSWKPTDEFMGYFLASKGNKPADFNDQYYRYDIAIDSTQMNCAGGCADGTLQAQQSGLDLVEEETQWTYEFGVKTSWFDRQLIANLSAFFIDWDNQAIFIREDIQTVSPTTLLPTTIRDNAGRTEIVGLELETNLIVNDHLSFVFNYGYNDGEFKEGTDSDLALLTGGDGDISGNEIPHTAKHSGVLSALATNQINTKLDGFARLDFIYESERWLQAANLNKIGDRKIINMRLGVETDTWTATGYVTNLTDDDTPLTALNFVAFGNTLSNGATPNLQSLSPQRGRQIGVEFQYRFGP